MRYILIFLLTSTITYPICSQNIGDIRMTDCFLEDCSWVENSTGVEFGFITVPEDYQKPKGRLIKVAFSIIKARVENPKSGAIIYFEGGWGVPEVHGTRGFMESYPVVDWDIILFDFRGTGFSEPALCTNFGEEVFEDVIANLSEEQFIEKQKIRLSQCLDSLELQQIDFLQYGSTNGMRDILVLMDQLDYDSYNLFGISYGTRRIQDLLRLSDEKVRSVILDSNCSIGMDQTFIGKMSQTYYYVISKLLSDCANDEQCNLAFPNLKQRFETFLTELENKPLHFLDGEAEVFLNSIEVNGILHQLLYNRYYYSDFPIMLDDLISRKSTALSHIIHEMRPRVIANSNGVGLINYVMDWNVYKQKIKGQYEYFLSSNNKNYEVLDLYLAYFLSDERFSVDSLNTNQVVSDVPALIGAGDYDPITPPSQGEFLLPNFKNSYYYKFPKEGHSVIPTPAGEDLMKQFFDRPEITPNDSILLALGNNDITFTTAYYQNDQIMSFVNGLTENTNWWLIVGIVVIAMVNLINSIVAVAQVVRKKTMSNRWAAVSSFLILLFLVGLGYFIQETAMHRGPLMLYGLVHRANLFFFFVPLILILVIIATVKILKQQVRKTWTFFTLVSYTLFAVLVFWFQLFPNI